LALANKTEVYVVSFPCT